MLLSRSYGRGNNHRVPGRRLEHPADW